MRGKGKISLFGWKERGKGGGLIRKAEGKGKEGQGSFCLSLPYALPSKVGGRRREPCSLPLLPLLFVPCGKQSSYNDTPL